jgi:aerobic carbon-monoxide dehydrogenase large subunit
MNQYGIGQPVRRVEDRRFVTGRGSYIDDLVRPRQAYAYMLRSPHAHARIRALDTAAAAAAPEVLKASCPAKMWSATGSARSLALVR